MSSVHEYPISVEWSGAFEGSGTATADRSTSQVTLAVPPEFKGTGAGTNPEELLASAVGGCYCITFGIVAANRRLPFLSVSAKVTGFVDASSPLPVYTKIVINPTITLGADATDDQVKMAEDMAHKADNYCIITNAIRGKVVIEVHPTVVRG